ncbi:guanylate kinase [Bartonella sp. DGB1]|uniref:guanylate kinase n=1 Tax=Bartonella sp. DGB1 TaxID=3239807 RepID=UPI00352650BE
MDINFNNLKNLPIFTRGFILSLSAPSGGGKSTLASRLMDDKSLNFNSSISITTRLPRGNEKNAIDYYFVSKEEFLQLVKNNSLLEWAEIHGHYYGTPYLEVEKNLVKGNNILFDINWEGVKQIKTICPEDIVSVFILPPSASQLKQRLHKRGEDNLSLIKKRIETAKIEIEQYQLFDYLLINDDIEQTTQQLISIIIAEQQKIKRKQNLSNFIYNFSNDL